MKIMKNKLQTTEKWIYYFMCGFALASCLSIAVQNIFLILSLLGLVYRLYLKHDDIKDALAIDKGLFYPFLAWAGAVVLSCIASAEPIWSLRVFGDYFGYRMAGLFIVLIAIRERQQIIRLWQLAFCSMFIEGGIVVYRYLTLGQREKGLLPIMSFAGMLSMLVPVLFLGSLLLKGKKRIICIGLTLGSLPVVVGNGTRGAWVAIIITVISVIVFALQTWRQRICASVAIVAVLGSLMMVPYVAGRTASITDLNNNRSNRERIYLWTSAYHMYQDHPLLGVGFGRFKKEYQSRYILSEAKNRGLGHAHSNVFHALGECGAIGAISFLFWWLGSEWYAIRKWFKEKNISFIVLFAILTGLLIQGLTEYNLGNSLVSKYFWFAVACCIQWSRISSHEKGI